MHREVGLLPRHHHCQPGSQLEVLMDSSTYSVIEDPLTSERPDNATPTSSEDWSLTAAVAEVTSLWTNTSRSIVAARTGLYIFLGATYEHAHNVQRNSSALHELRLEVRRQFSSDRQKKRIGSASAEELLLVSALGVNQGSLRSKYKALFAKAANEQIPRDRESFKFWLWSNGGIVKALRDAVSDDARRRALYAPYVRSSPAQAICSRLGLRSQSKSECLTSSHMTALSSCCSISIRRRSRRG